MISLGPIPSRRLGKSLGINNIVSPIAIISNASLLTKKEVRDSLTLADWASVKVDAANEEIWRMFDRPVTALTFEAYLSGLHSFADEFTGNAFDGIFNITAVHPLREDAMEELLRNDKSNTSVISSLLHMRLINKVKYNGKIFYYRQYRPSL
ncbi:hypothetical protein [Prolixibacter sp. SD074]|jgi:wyosine [tRNA(Phe)-imidazoG37] synthetase (radical SAM superfamily)|uniref:hypothetical protein n=1 Tax=Prolixibacter sp. SD074 TaxID=2652391 RepID=UPI001281A64A|nr:hypothetical protein [Prolixibacter sp. SD074]GET29495.1 hypothetical protein SD074_16970 [Prolixibacter sp. SD074]